MVKCMIHIKDYAFEKNIDIKSNKIATNWPVVYLIENGKQIYIGETNSFKRRMKQHYMNSSKRVLNKVHLISDNDFNKSAIRDIESALIGYFDADKKFELLNIGMYFDTITTRTINVYVTDGTNDYLLYSDATNTNSYVFLEYGNDAYKFDNTKEIKVVIGSCAATTIDLSIDYEILEEYANA